MANYIGNVPASGEFKRLDSIASSFDGTTTQFNLAYNTVSQTAGDASQLIVSLNGIVQEPLESYTLGIGGSSIIFSTAPASGDACHIVLLGGVGSTITPSDGSVTATKLDASLKDYYEDEYVADGSTTDFTLSRESAGVNSLFVTIDGIVQPTSAYTATGTTLTISPALPNGTNIRVVHMGVKAGVYVPQAGSVGLNEIDLTAFDNRYYQENDTAVFGTVRSTGTAQFDNAINLKAATTNYIYFDDALQLAKNGTGSRLHIDASGNVGIGNSTPSQPLEVKGNIKSNGAENGNVSNLIMTRTDRSWRIANETDLRFYTASGDTDSSSTKVVTINNAGHVLIGVDDLTGANSPEEGTNTSALGVTINNYGPISSAAYQTHGLSLNRLSTDGPVARFKKDGSELGNLTVHTNKLTMTAYDGNTVAMGSSRTDGNAAGFYMFHSTNSIIPYKSSDHTLPDGVQSLGHPSYRWKDLYLTGGIQFDSRSNKLDDYEEGYHDTTVYINGGTFSGDYYARRLRYVKIGALVHVVGRLYVGSVPTGGSNYFSFSLPFVAPASTEYETSNEMQNIRFNDGYTFRLKPDGAGRLYLQVDGTDVAMDTGNPHINVSFTYIVA